MHGRRQFLKSASAIVATTAIAGCNTDAGGENAATTDPDTATTEATGTTDQATDSRAAVTADAAVAAQWNVYRARLADAAALGTAGEAEVAARTVSGVFEDFENAGGEYGAHETLEATSEDHYEGFESAVVAMREALAGGDTSTARDHHRTADDHLAAAQRSLVGDTAADALDVLSEAIPEASLDRALILFPDPWPKKKHHKRRLIQPDFVAALHRTIRPGGVLHIATDWEPYAEHILEVMNEAAGYRNLSEDGTTVARPADRPLTKFEKRGEARGHGVADMLFERQ